jgi:hypothetical protein
MPAASTRRSRSPTGSSRPASTPASARSATPTTTPWRPSHRLGSTRANRSTGTDRGATATTSKQRPWTGCRGSTLNDPRIHRRPHPGHGGRTALPLPSPPRRGRLRPNEASGNAGAAQSTPSPHYARPTGSAIPQHASTPWPASAPTPNSCYPTPCTTPASRNTAGQKSVSYSDSHPTPRPAATGNNHDHLVKDHPHNAADGARSCRWSPVGGGHIGMRDAACPGGRKPRESTAHTLSQHRRRRLADALVQRGLTSRY